MESRHLHESLVEKKEEEELPYVNCVVYIIVLLIGLFIVFAFGMVGVSTYQAYEKDPDGVYMVLSDLATVFSILGCAAMLMLAGLGIYDRNRGFWNQVGLKVERIVTRRGD